MMEHEAPWQSHADIQLGDTKGIRVGIGVQFNNVTDRMKRTKFMRMRFVPILLIVASMSPVAHAGAVLELLTTEYTQDPPIIGTVQISTEGRESRIEITSVSSNESGGMIYRSGKKEMIAMDHAAREYYVIDQATMDRMAAQVRSAMEQTQAALDAMSPEERALAEQMIQRSLSADAEAVVDYKLVASGKGDEIAGFECSYYDVVQDGRKIRDLCVTPWSEIAEGKQAAEAMMELADFFENMRKAFAGAGGLDAMDRQQEMFAYMEELGGYPVLSRDYDVNGRLESESRLQAARSENISASLFDPPPGYQQLELK
jgi:hypothetical protein